jgi:putative dehydrogenase
MTGTVGIVGLGIMGGAMARNLVAGGWRVIGFDIERARCAELAPDGIEIADSIAAVAREAQSVITSLPSPQAVALAAREIAAAGLDRHVVIEASTLALDDKLAFESTLREAGHVALDSPLSGTGAQAKTKDLVVYASGDTAAIEAQRPLFAGFARATHDVGVFGNGTRMKLVAQNLGAPTPLFCATEPIYAAAMGLGLAGQDTAAVCAVLERMAGIQRAAGPHDEG